MEAVNNFKNGLKPIFLIINTCIAYNNAFRGLLGLPWRCSASGMFADSGTDGFTAVMRKRVASLWARVRGSPNTLLKVVADRTDSPMINHWMSTHMSIGLFPISLGTAMAIDNAWEEPIFGTLLVGTLILGLSALGLFGAILEKKTLLVIYSALLGLVSVVELVMVLKLTCTKHFGMLVFALFHTVMTLSALLLAMALIKKPRKQLNPVIPVNLVGAPSAPTAL